MGARNNSGKRIARALLAALLVVSVAPVLALADPGVPGPAEEKTAAPQISEVSESMNYVPGEVIVRFKDGTTGAARSSAHRGAGAKDAHPIDAIGQAELATLASGKSVKAAVKSYSTRAEVVYAQPNYIYETHVAPTDEFFDQLWGMNNTGQTGGTPDADIDAVEAWDLESGESSVVIAVIDTGIDVTHPDLAANVWVNTGEVPSNGLDDDSNGFIDDVNGYDFLRSDGSPNDENSHGTHVSGTVAAAKNDTGVVGVAYDGRVMGLKFLDDTGHGDTEDAIAAIGYAGQMGADVINCSWGGGLEDQALYDAMEAFEGPIICSSGNDGVNTDSNPTYPASFDLPQIISVASTDHNDALASSSNYGLTTVDLSAPGVEILSSIPGERFFEEDMPPLFTDSLADMSAWETTSYAGKQVWALNSDRYVSSPTCVANSSYANDEDSWLIMKNPVDLTGATDAVLAYRLWLDVEWPYDFVRSYVSTDKATWMELEAYTGSSYVWLDERIELTPWAGEPAVYIAFRLQSDEVYGGDFGYDGAYVDDVAINSGTWGDPDYSNPYDTYSGTSMAAPHVSGAAALLLSMDASLTASEIKQTLMNTVDPLTGLSGKVASGGRLNLYRALGGDQDSPVVTDDHVASYIETATINLSATDATTVVSVTYSVDGGSDVVVPGSEATVIVSGSGTHTLRYFAEDALGNVSDPVQVGFSIVREPVTYQEIEGPTRYETAVQASKNGFPEGASTAVVATGRNWPDALGGAALAGAASGPVLLTGPDSLPAVVKSELERLEVSKVYILGGIGAVGPSVQTELEDMLGFAAVKRLGGSTRYSTARLIAEETISLLGGSYDGTVLVATGSGFPDALSGSPLGYANGWPLVLATSSGGYTLPPSASQALILGGTGVVSTATELNLKADLGAADVERIFGANRYGTAAEVAKYGVTGGMSWNGAGLATGATFPDALSGGALLGSRGSVMLLSRTSVLPSEIAEVLDDNRDEIREFTFLGGEGAVSSAVRAEVKGILQ